jgi:Zn-dependent protease
VFEKLSQARPTVRTAVAILSFLASLFAFLILTWNWGIAIAVMVAVALHELCHLLAFRSYGIKSGIIFLLFFAWTYPVGPIRSEDPLAATVRMFWVLPAGLIGNVLLGFAALALVQTWPLAGFVALLNFYLALFNLAPMDASDGGKIVRIVTFFSPAKKKTNAVQAIILAEAAAFLAATYFIQIGRLDWLIGTFIQIMFGVDLFFQLIGGRRRAREQFTPRLTEKEAWRWALVYAVILIATIAGILILPAGNLIP